MLAEEPTVFVVDDDEAIRQSMHWLLVSDGLRVDTFARAEDFLTAYSGGPGCLVLDIRMPGIDGMELLEEIQGRDDRLPIIMISGHGDISKAVRAMKLGAIDFIEKPFDDHLLLERIRQAIEIDAKTRAKKSHLESIEKLSNRLSPREREVAQLLIEGQSNKEIAASLNRSIKTVEIHRANLMRKMQADSLAELVRKILALQAQEA